MLSTLTASFPIGVPATHEVRIAWSPWGRERYFVDGELVLSAWNLQMSAIRQFGAHGHAIEVRLAMTLTRIDASAYVDGQLVASDLFPDFNAKLQQRTAGREPSTGRAWWAEVALWSAIALTAFNGVNYFERRRAGPDKPEYQPLDAAQPDLRLARATEPERAGPLTAT